MSFFKHSSSSQRELWSIFPNTPLVSLLRILIDVSNNVYVHFTIVVIGFFNVFSLYLHQPPFSYGYVAVALNAFMPVHGIINMYAYWKKEAFSRTLERALCTVESECGTSPCDISTILLFAIPLFLTCFVPLLTLCKTEYWFIAFQVIWCVWMVYNASQVCGFCLAVSVPRYCFYRMRCSLTDEIVSKESIVGFIGIYDELIGICVDIDRHFGLRNTSNIVFDFGALIFQTFFVIEGYLDWMMINKGWSGWAAFIAYSGFVGGIVGLLILGCSSVEKEAEKFNQVLSSLVMRDKSGSLAANPYVTSHFAIGKKLKFSACGCFYIDYRLGYSMLATCVTYLVILVEFNRKNVPAESTPDVII